MTCFLINASAFVLAVAATALTFGGNAVLARHQFATAGHVAVAAPVAPPQHVIVVARRHHA